MRHRKEEEENSMKIVEQHFRVLASVFYGGGSAPSPTFLAHMYKYMYFLVCTLLRLCVYMCGDVSGEVNDVRESKSARKPTFSM